MASFGSRISFLVVLCLAFGLSCCYGSGSFGFDIHHRFSDSVKGLLPFDNMPEVGSEAYYAFMHHRDRMLHGRRLSSSTDLTKLTFEYGNETYYITQLGFLQYANVSMGNPRKWFLVALDTGSDLFWLPCDCTSCVKGLNTTTGVLKLNIYSPEESTSSKAVPCSSPLCSQTSECSGPTDTCPFNVNYLSVNTSSNGFLVEDVLHMVTDDDQTKAFSPRVTFGCGKVLTGLFLEGGAPNGLFGLGLEDESVPSILASQGLIPNSFSMCFGYVDVGRISFGDLGSSDQGETSFALNQPHYYITVTNITVESNKSDMHFTAIFDSGTSFTYLTEPAYSFLTEAYDAHANNPRHNNTSDFPFANCYDLGPNDPFILPEVNLTMKGGDILTLYDPTVIFLTETGGYVYCLGLFKSDELNIIGQNFMTGYRIVFNREKNILGWKLSDCSDQTSPLSASPDTSSPAVPPAPTVKTIPPPPTTTTNTSKTAPPPPTGNHSPQSNKFSYPIMIMIILSLISIF